MIKNDSFKKRYLLAILTPIVFLMLISLSSCSLFGGDNTPKVAPTIDSNSLPRMQRINPDYKNEEGKNDYYYDENAIMPVLSGENVFIIIDYKNPSNLSINKVIINGGGKEYEILSRNFEKESDTNRTVIKFKIEDAAQRGEVRTYTISKIYYNMSSQVLSMKLNEEQMQFKVKIDPQFKIIFDHQNANPIMGDEGTTSEVTVDFFQSLADIIPTISTYETHPNAPKKSGGWAFRGYYTDYDGKGIQIKNTDKFYFWQDITLKAYFERLYEFEVKNAEQPIVVEEDGEQKVYNKVAKITKKTSAGDAQRTLEIFDTIADDRGIYPIVEIGDGAFSNTFNMETLIIGRFVKRIGKDAFSSSRVNTVTFHSQGCLEIIDDRAFYGTVNLGEKLGFTLPDTVTYLGDRCFESSGWGKMTARGDTMPKSTLVIYDNITHIGDWCFTKTKFTEVIFMPGVKFKADAVKGENYVEEIEGEQIEADSDYYLGWCLFKSCERINTFRTQATSEQADGLEIVTDGMFDLFSHSTIPNVGLTKVVLAEGLKRIGKGAFHYQKLLTAIYLPATLEDICGDNKLNGEKNFEGTRNEKSEYGAFAECHDLETVTFADNSQLKVIGCDAFYNNRKLKEIHIKSKVLEYYGDGPFRGCEKLTMVTFDFDNDEKIPEPLTYNRLIRKGADFFYSEQSFKVFVKDNVLEGFRESFGTYASDTMKRKLPIFCEGMKVILKDERNQEIGKMYLEETADVLDPIITGWKLGYITVKSAEVVIPDKHDDKRIVTIGPYAVDKEVQSVRLPKFTSRIDDYAFCDCKQLSEITFGDILPDGEEDGIGNLKEIGEQAFYSTAIAYFVGGHNLDTIGAKAFWNCKSLVWADLGASKIEDKLGTAAFMQCTSLKYVRLPSTFRHMADSTFADCKALRYMVFKNGYPDSSLMFQKNIQTYFQGVPEGVIAAYVTISDAVGRYNGLQNLPAQLKGRFIYDPDKPDPNPTDFHDVAGS